MLTLRDLPGWELKTASASSPRKVQAFVDVDRPRLKPDYRYGRTTRYVFILGEINMNILLFDYVPKIAL